jgi:potassium-transporting ATPase KdpC subunit
MRRQLLPALRMVVVLTLLTGMLYPLAITGIGQAVLNDRANGSLLRRDGQVVGSRLQGQLFTAPDYFHARPSSAGDGYDGSATAGSNLGPTNPDLAAEVRKRIADYRQLYGLAADAPVPIDAVTASGSGLDPHISTANADLQVARVAQARGLDETAVRELVAANTQRRPLRLLGEDTVHVLELNLALDERFGRQ